jgi:hypothetical protein
MNVADRRARRDELLRELPAWYSPWLHLGAPTAVGLAAIAFAVATVEQVSAGEAMFVAVTAVAANATEWRAHKSLLHHRVRGAELLFDRHTPVHHHIFPAEDMAIRSARELYFVLIPAWGILLILLATSPITLALWAFGQTDLAALFVATCASYVVSYEWLHTAYHLPDDSFVGRRSWVRWLRRHHQAHHRPELMQKWNFNVSLPLWDWVRGTWWTEGKA